VADEAFWAHLPDGEISGRDWRRRPLLGCGRTGGSNRPGSRSNFLVKPKRLGHPCVVRGSRARLVSRALGDLLGECHANCQCDCYCDANSESDTSSFGFGSCLRVRDLHCKSESGTRDPHDSSGRPAAVAQGDR
jgi:hypothetical protein